jgi:MFS family permease
VAVLAAYRDVLRNGPLGRLLVAEFVSSIGDWLYLVALLIIVYRESNDPVLLGVVGAARVLPYVVLSIPAGIVADRYDRRLVLLVTDVVRGLIMVALAFLVATDGPIAAVVGLAILATCFSAFFSPAIGAYLPALVKDERELGPANSAWSTLDNLAFIIGPAIAGLLIATSGLTIAFILNAISFAVVAVVLWGLPVGRARPDADDESESETPPAQDARLPMLRPIAGLAMADITAAFAFGGLGILTVVLAVEQLGAGEEGTGYLNAAIGVGAVVGAIVSGAIVLRSGLRAPLIAGSLVLGAGLAALGVAPGLALALVAMAVASGGSLVVEVASTTLFQRVVPDAVRGRALGVTGTLSTLAYAAGSLLLPIAAGVVGIAPVLLGSGVLVVVGALAGVALIPAAALGAPKREIESLAERLAGRDVFAGMLPARLATTLSNAEDLRVPGAAVVIREGEPADRFYVIRDGRFVVSQGPNLLRTLKADDVFGELGLLRGSPRTATVTAETDGRLLAVSADDFLELVSAAPDLRPRLLALYRGRPTVR